MERTTPLPAVSASRLAPLDRLRGLVRRILGIVAVWFFGLWLLSWAAVAFSGITHNWIGEPSAAHFNEQTQPFWLYVWSRWDGQWYLNIAYYHYGGIPYDAAFFPLYPTLVALVYFLTGSVLPWATNFRITGWNASITYTWHTPNSGTALTALNYCWGNCRGT